MGGQALLPVKHFQRVLAVYKGQKIFGVKGGTDTVTSTQRQQTATCIHKTCLKTVVCHTAFNLVVDAFHSHPKSHVLAGVPLDIDGMPDNAAEAVVNTAAVDLLRRLPGVTEANYRALMHATDSLAGLADLPSPQLEAVMGGTAAAKKLREWLDAVCPVMA